MTDRGAMEDDRGRRGRRAPLVLAALIALIIVALLTMAACGQQTPTFFQRTSDQDGCPRPASVTGAEFNDQERTIRALRKAAFRGDFFAQLELGLRYGAERATDKNLEDPIESAVWTAMALSNEEGYAPINRVNDGPFGGWRPLSRYDDCRAVERKNAYDRLNRTLSRMTREEQEEVRDRVIYVLSTQDAPGFRTLARLHDGLYGPFGEPQDNRQGREARGRRDGRGSMHAAVNLFQRNDVDAYLYNYLATQTGDVGAYVLLKDFENSSPSRKRYGAFVEAKARQWVPPFEFYPNKAPASGVPFSDESRPRGDAFEFATARITELPFIHIGRALRYLGVSEIAASTPDTLSKREIESLEATLGHPMDGRLSLLERVRAIQMAAVQGSSEAQLVLAVMYAEGIGVPIDYARSFHWFEEAARQGSPEAKFALSSYFALGVAGVADQDKAEAVVMRIDSALAGFAPSAARLSAVLAQVSRSQQRR